MSTSHAPIIGAGRLRGRRLAVPAGLTTRPTRSLVRQAFFNMLGTHLAGARVLDLYSGSGALGLEALSRGAAWVTLVESDRRALVCLRRNVEDCRVGPEAARIVPVDARTFRPAADEGGFTLVQADPPFALRDYLPESLEAPGVLSPTALLMLHGPSERPGYPPGPGWRLLRTRTHGRSSLHLFERAPG